MEEITQEHIDQSQAAALDSVTLINGVIDGSLMVDESSQEKTDAVARNVQHLQIMVSKEWFTTDAAIDAAIAAGDGWSA